MIQQENIENAYKQIKARFKDLESNTKKNKQTKETLQRTRKSRKMEKIHIKFIQRRQKKKYTDNKQQQNDLRRNKSKNKTGQTITRDL